MSRDLIQILDVCPNQEKEYDPDWEEEGRERKLKLATHDNDIGQQYMAMQAQLMAD